MALDINNTARDWKKFLSDLAAEAARDADNTPRDFALYNVLYDLHLVALAYSERLVIERGEDVEADDNLKQLVPGETQLVTDVPLAASDAGPVSPSVLPDWLLETLRNMGEEIERLKARVLALENNQQLTVITPAPQYAVEEISVIDEDRSAWNSVDRARAALRGMVGREHQKKSRIRQAILARVTMLATQPGELSADERAELRQHQDRAAELAEIDAIAGVKLDEIAGIDDLIQLREYDHLKGWPQ
jgi:hypothetical protein